MPKAYLPKHLPREFVEDVVKLQRLLYSEGMANLVYGIELQREMRGKYKTNWIAWVRKHVGIFEKP